MFQLWRSVFTEGRIIPSAFLEKVRRELARAVDTENGGIVAPTSPIKIFGQGLSINPLTSVVQAGLLTALGTAQLPARVSRLAPVGSNLAVHDPPYDVYLVEGSGMTAARSITLDVSADTVEGEIVLFAAYEIDEILTIESEGATTNNPLFSMPGGGAAFNWVALWFDPTLDGDNALGEWAVAAHGGA